MSIYIARELGAVVFGAFTLAYVTYSFALNASRGLATDPLLVRFSGADPESWRRAVAGCTGTAVVVGLVSGGCTLVAALLLNGSSRLAFLALGLTLPFLLLQDSWRFAFFAVRRGNQALLNDAVWLAALIPALGVLRLSGNKSVFWCVFAWGASAGVAAAVGPLQAKLLPDLSRVRQWVTHHRDLGPRYLVEGTANSASAQLRGYGVSAILGLAALGYVQAANTLMGPFMVVFFGMGLVLLPEAVRLLRRSTRDMVRFCSIAGVGLALVALAWAVVLWVALPRGLGHLLLGQLWRPAYPLVLPLTIQTVGGCFMAGAGIGLHALGAARRSMRAMLISSVVYVGCALFGAATGGALGTMRGGAVAAWIGAIVFWTELRAGLRGLGYELFTARRLTRRGAPLPAAELLAAELLPVAEPRPAAEAAVTHQAGYDCPKGWRVVAPGQARAMSASRAGNEPTTRAVCE